MVDKKVLVGIAIICCLLGFVVGRVSVPLQKSTQVTSDETHHDNFDISSFEKSYEQEDRFTVGPGGINACIVDTDHHISSLPYKEINNKDIYYILIYTSLDDVGKESFYIAYDDKVLNKVIEMHANGNDANKRIRLVSDVLVDSGHYYNLELNGTILTDFYINRVADNILGKMLLEISGTQKDTDMLSLLNATLSSDKKSTLHKRTGLKEDNYKTYEEAVAEFKQSMLNTNISVYLLKDAEFTTEE